MPDKTDCLLLPYPLITDGRPDVPKDIKALAEKVDDVLCGTLTDIDGIRDAVANCVRVPGDTMTGTLVANGNNAGVDIRRPGNSPYLQFSSHTTGTPIYGMVQAEGDEHMMRYHVTNAAGVHRWTIGSTVDVMRLQPGGHLQIDGMLDAYSFVRSKSYGQFGGAGNQVRLVDTTGGSVETPTVHIGWWRNGTYDAPTNRGAWMGFNGNTTLQVINEVANSAIAIACNQAANGSGGIYIRSGLAGDVIIDCGDDIFFQTNQITRGVMNGDRFIWGKSATDFAVVGVEMISSGGSEGAIWSTISGKGYPNLSLRRRGDASVDNEWFVHCLNHGGSSVGGIRAVGTTSAISAVEIVGTATSDYRVKSEVGPLDDGLERLLRLRPIRYVRSDQDTGTVYDGLIAHEVAEVVPQAVRGEKDAVQADGTPDLQDMYGDRLVPLLVAAVQELNRAVNVLSAEVLRLKEDCCG